MTTTPPPSIPPQGEPGPEERSRAVRVDDGRWLGGVCMGLSVHLGVPVLLIRLGFVALAAVQFIGAALYAVLWVVMPPELPAEKAPGLEAASHTGSRTVAVRVRRRQDIGSAVAMLLLGIGVLWLLQSSRFAMAWDMFWPIMLAGAGGALIWREADSMGQRQLREQRRPGRRRHRWARQLLSLVIALCGLALVGVALVLVIPDGLRALWGAPMDLLTALVLTIGGVAVVGAPWFFRARAALDLAREERIRADARADMAAHLHDSVLQTFALIQRQASDPRAVTRLARRQERELREWLYGSVPDETTLAAAIRLAVTEVEDEHDIDVELVTVGDAELTPQLDAVVRAAREAMVNAAKHARVDRVDVYAEVVGETVEVFIRDRGAGFDLDSMEADRQGVRRSIMERMERYGGRAVVRSAPGQGTDVRLEMTR